MAKNTQAPTNAQAAAKSGAQEQVIMEVGPNVKCVVVDEKAPAPKEACGYQIVVQPPAPKATVAYLVGPGAEVVLKGIDTDKARIVEEGENLRITTADGGEILLLDFVTSAKSDDCTALVTEQGTVKGKKLLASVEEDHAKVEPAAGPESTVRPVAAPVARGSGLQAPEVSSSFGFGDEVLSSVIGPFAIPFGRDSIEYKEYPTSTGTIPPAAPPGPNTPPDANDDSATVACGVVCGKSVTINVLANDVDPDGNPLTVTGVSGVNPAHGSASIVGNQIVFTPASGFTGVTSFSYSISDGQGGTDTATVTVTVTNTPPDAVDDITSTAFQTPVTIDVLANDTDAECKPGVTITGISGLDPVTEGTAQIVNGKIVFTPAAGVSGTIKFFYSIADGCGGTDMAEVCVIIGTPPPVNDNPDAKNDTATVACGVVCGKSVTINVLANDVDPNGDPLTITGISGLNPALGTATIVSNQIVFVPASGVTGVVTFNYSISDGNGGTDTAQVTVTVTNTPPDAVNDSANTAFNSPVTIDVLANDTDAECKPGVTITGISGVNNAHGTAQIVAGQIVFTPANGFSGTTSFQYSIADGCGGTDTATVTVTVGNNPNNPPDAKDDTATVGCVNALCGCGSGVKIAVLANDTDPNGDPLTITAVGTPANGVATLNGDGTISYKPNAGFSGTDTFTYTISDGKGGFDTATVTVTVTNTPPDAINDAASTAFQTSVSFNVLANDIDPDVGVLQVNRIVTNPANGSISWDVAGNIVYTPANGFSGVDTFQYEVIDGCGAKDIATVTITVGTPPNDNPDARNDTATVKCTVVCGSSVTINVLANDTDPNGDPLTITGITGVNPAHGTATIVGNQIVFVPASGFTGNTVFSYSISDGKGGTDTATVTVNVTNTPPDAVNDNTSTAFQTPVTINVLANDSDPDCPAGLSITGISGVNNAHGTAAIVNGQIVFTPANGFSGTTSFQYSIADGCGGVDTATVTVVVGVPPNSPPDANNDSATVACGVVCGKSVTINVLANDTDPNNDTLTVTGVSGVNPAHGTATIVNNQLLFTPAAGFVGVTTFSYSISDGKGGTDTATVTVTVTNTPPNANDDLTATAFNTPVTIDVLANDTDAECKPGVTITGISGLDPVTEGTAQIVAGKIVFTPATGVSGTIKFFYSIADGCGGTDMAEVCVVISPPPNLPPDANPDTATVKCTAVCGSSVTINVLANDTDPNGDPLTITGVSGLNPALGTATIVNNQIVFVPASGVTGTVQFSYSISDGKGGTDTAAVTVTITNTPPDAVNDFATTAFNTNVTINVLANDSDAECTAGLRITGISGVNPAHGSASIVNGKIVFDPANTFTGTTYFQYTITDGCGGTDTATVCVTVGAPPPPPPPPPPISPLVIDLDGTGFHLLASNENNHQFDLTGDGQADTGTAWFGNTMGILARDYNGNGTIDGIGEVYGNAQMDGYSELRMLEDTNTDGVIDANDAGWDELRIWVDANSDGISQADELYGLAHFGIVSIDAMGTENYIGMGDEAFISHTGSVTLADGRTLDSADVWFNMPSAQTTGNGDEIVIDPAVLAAATGDDVAALPAQSDTTEQQVYVAPVATATEEQTQVVIH